MTSGLAGLNMMVSHQAAMIAYLDDYKLMMVLTVAVIPLLVLLRPPAAGRKHEVAMMD